MVSKERKRLFRHYWRFQTGTGRGQYQELEASPKVDA